MVPEEQVAHARECHYFCDSFFANVKMNVNTGKRVYRYSFQVIYAHFNNHTFSISSVFCFNCSSAMAENKNRSDLKLPVTIKDSSTVTVTCCLLSVLTRISLCSSAKEEEKAVEI